MYAVPVLLPPAKPDNSKTHKSSDHSYAMAIPINRAEDPRNREYKIKINRPIVDSSQVIFANMILQVSRRKVFDARSSSDKVKVLELMANDMVDIAFPQVTTKISVQDKPFITAEIKKLDRARKKEFFKKGKTAMYKDLDLK